MDQQQGQVALERVQSLREAAEGAMQQGEIQRAYDLFTEALEALGMAYYDTSVLDDTDVRVLAAEDQYGQGNVEGAARMLEGILGERLQMYEQKHKPPPTGVQCPSCGATNPLGSRFCNQCGTILRCPSCGATNSPGSRFCNQCGTQLLP